MTAPPLSTSVALKPILASSLRMSVWLRRSSSAMRMRSGAGAASGPVPLPASGDSAAVVVPESGVALGGVTGTGTGCMAREETAAEEGLRLGVRRSGMTNSNVAPKPRPSL